MNKESSIYKIVIDTNIWVSFLIGKRIHRLLQCILDERVVVITCNAQMLELLRVVEKPKIKKMVFPHQITAFIHFLEAHTVKVPVTTKINLCRDPKDDFLLSLSIDSTAHYLLSGDNDLLVLQQINDTSIISFSAFEKILNAE